MKTFVSGLACKRLLVSVFLLLLGGMVFSLDDNNIKLTYPHFTGSNSSVDDLNSKAENVFDTYRNSIKSELSFLPSNLNKLAGGFANASVFSSDGASQRGYKGYNAFSFTFGPMLAFQLPQLSLIYELMDVARDGGIGPELFEKIANVSFGFDPKISTQFGINTSFLLKDLYLGVKFSKFDTNWIKGMPSDLSFSTTSIGVNASYQLISQKRLLAGLLVWRGLNLGAGFIWQNTNWDVAIALPISNDLRNIQISDDVIMPVDMAFNLGLKTNNYIVPLEAMTSIRLVGFLNLALGAGVDVAIGSSSIEASGSFRVNKNNVTLPQGVEMYTEPELSLNLGGKLRPSFFNVKGMLAVGFNFGPVIIDIPVTYYLMNNGFSVGITSGVTL